MKIIHTADWHIGKVLHKVSLRKEMEAFLDWLYDLIQEKEIDVLLISGDIFDSGNPSSGDRALYYSFLARLMGLDIHVVITGGNHDSIAMLEAPAELLSSLDVTVVGGAKQDLNDELIYIKTAKGEEVVIAAVPFLRTKDLRVLDKDASYKNRGEEMQESIRRHYHALADLCKKHYPKVTAIAMGHLYARGVSISDSEREIHVGNSAPITIDAFSDYYDYIALGHIHRPQVIGENEMVRFSGSPIPLSFSERDDQKSLLLIELKDKTINPPIVIKIPLQRALVRFSGTLDEVKQKLSSYDHQYALPSLIELAIHEEQHNALKILAREELTQHYENHEKLKIVKSTISFEKGGLDTSDLFQTGTQVEDLVPLDLFKKKLELEELDQEDFDSMVDLFKILLEEVYQK